MQPIIYKIRLDAGKPGSQARIHVKQGEAKSRLLSVYLCYGSVPYIIKPGATAIIHAVKPDATEIYNDCEISGDVINYLMDPQMLAAPGSVNCELSIFGPDGEVLFSPEFEVLVSDKLSNDEEIVSSDEFSALTTAMSEAAGLTAKWSNPVTEAVEGEAPDVDIELGADNVKFKFTLPSVGGEGGGGGGIYFETDETLILEDGVLRVNTADKPEEDNTLPITSAAVATTVGNIDAILKTI